MKKSDLLKQKAKGKLSTGLKAPEPSLSLVPQGGELLRLTIEIRSDLDELRDISEWWKVKKERIAEIKISVIEKLIFVRDNSKKLLTGKKFEDYLVNDIGISKGYFYEQIQAYNVCKEYNQPALFKDVDHKILVGIAREKDPVRQKELISRAPELTRESVQKVSPTDFLTDSPKTVSNDSSADLNKMVKTYSFEIVKFKIGIEKLVKEYSALEKKHKQASEKHLNKKEKEKGLVEREKAQIYSDFITKLETSFAHLQGMVGTGVKKK